MKPRHQQRRTCYSCKEQRAVGSFVNSKTCKFCKPEPDGETPATTQERVDAAEADFIEFSRLVREAEGNRTGA